MSVWHKVSSSWVGGLPLLGACRAVSELPLISKQHVEVGVVPLCWSWSPCTFDSAGGGITTNTGSVGVLPAGSLQLDWCALWLRSDKSRVARSVGLAKCVSTGGEGNSFLIVHRHACEGLTNVGA